MGRLIKLGLLGKAKKVDQVCFCSKCQVLASLSVAEKFVVIVGCDYSILPSTRVIVQLGIKLNIKLGLDHHHPPTTTNFSKGFRLGRRLRFYM